jgi:hypothetical protein
MWSAILHFRQCGSELGKPWRLVDILPPLPAGSLVTAVQMTQSQEGCLEVFAVVVPPVTPHSEGVAGTAAVPSFHPWLLQPPSRARFPLVNPILAWLKQLVTQPVTKYPAHSLSGLDGVPRGLDVRDYPGGFRLELPQNAARNPTTVSDAALGVSAQPKSVLVNYRFKPQTGWTGPCPLRADGKLVDGVTGVPAILPCASSGHHELFVPRGSVIDHYVTTGEQQNGQYSWEFVEALPEVARDSLIGQVWTFPSDGNLELVARVGKTTEGFGAYRGCPVSYTSGGPASWSGPAALRVN